MGREHMRARGTGNRGQNIITEQVLEQFRRSAGVWFRRAKGHTVTHFCV